MSSSNGKVFDSIDDAQAQLDVWVREYNFDRRHQGIGDVVPWERFRLAGEDHAPEPVDVSAETSTTRKVGQNRQDQLRCPSSTRSGCGWLVRPSRSRSRTAWSASITEACSWPPTPSGTARPKRPKALAPQGEGVPSQAASAHRRPDRDPQGRLLGQRLSFAGFNYEVGNATPAARSRSRSSATPWRSPPVERLLRVHPDPPRPLPRTRRLRQRWRPTLTHQRRLKPPSGVEHSYRSQTGTRVPELDTQPMSGNSRRACPAEPFGEGLVKAGKQVPVTEENLMAAQCILGARTLVAAHARDSTLSF